MHVKSVIACLLILLSTGLGAQEYHYNLKFRLSPKHFADTIGIEVADGRIYIPVTIGGHPHRFLLDTGASMGALFTAPAVPPASAVPPVLCAAASPQPAGVITSHDATGQARSTEVVRLPNLQIGRITVSGCHATVLRRLSPGADCAGIIGFDIFNKGIVAKIDTRQRQLILTDDRRHFRREPGYEVRYRLKRHVPYVVLRPFGQYQDTARFDTGDRSLYTLSRQSFDAATAGSADGMTGQVEGRTTGSLRVGHFGAETAGEVVALCLRELDWGGFAFLDVHTLTAQGPSAVGTALLDYGAVVIDPHRRRLVFQPYAGSGQCRIDNRLPDIYYVPDRQGRPTVGLVWEQSEPYRQGFRRGDVITSVNGTAVNTVADFTGYPFVANQVYTVAVRGADGVPRQLRITK